MLKFLCVLGSVVKVQLNLGRLSQEKLKTQYLKGKHLYLN